MKSKEMEEQIEIKVSPRLAWAVLAGKGGMVVVVVDMPLGAPSMAARGQPTQRGPHSRGSLGSERWSLGLPVLSLTTRPAWEQGPHPPTSNGDTVVNRATEIQPPALSPPGGLRLGLKGPTLSSQDWVPWQAAPSLGRVGVGLSKSRLINITKTPLFLSSLRKFPGF